MVDDTVTHGSELGGDVGADAGSHRSFPSSPKVSSRFLVGPALCVVLAFLVIFLLHNYRALLTKGLTPTELAMPEMAFDQSTQMYLLEFNDINMDVRSIEIRSNGVAGTVEVQGADDGSTTYYDMGEMDITQNNYGSEHVSSFVRYRLVDAHGRLRSLRLYSEEKLDVISSVRVNVEIPFDLQLQRVVVLAAIFVALWVMRPSSVLYRMSYTVLGRRAYVVIWALMSALLLVVGMWRGLRYLSSMNVTAENASTELGEVYKWASVYTRTDHEYAEMAKALAHGSLSIEAEPTEALKALENPYDWEARRSTGTDYLWDYAYYQGKYYMYFGVAPCLVFFLPFYLVTGAELPVYVPIMALAPVYAAGVLALLRRICKRWYPQTSLGAFLGAFAGVMLAGWIFYSMMRPNTYSVPIVASLACSVWAIDLWMRAVEGTEVSYRWAALATFLGALNLACRPQFVLVMLVGLAILVEGGRRGVRIKPSRLAATFAPALVVFAAVGWYNWARFGSPLDFGAAYNLTTNDLTNRGSHPLRAAYGIFYNLLRPVSFKGAQPFLESVRVETGDLVAVYSESLPGSLTFTVPVLLWPLALLLGHKRGRHLPKGTAILMTTLLCLTVVLVVLDAEGGGVSPRYFLDFGTFFAIAATMAYLSTPAAMVVEDDGAVASSVADCGEAAAVAGDVGGAAGGATRREGETPFDARTLLRGLNWLMLALSIIIQVWWFLWMKWE